jgi:large subunit ribosomal protein L32
MAVPKRKVSQSRKGKRRSHDALRRVHPTKCSRCGTPSMPHEICHVCGHYRGKPVIAVEEF